MKKILAVILQLSAFSVLAEEQAVTRPARTSAAQAGGFSADLPAVVRVQGATTFFYTSLDVTNNSAQPTDVLFEYISGDLAVDVAGSLVTGLAAHHSFHQDDFIEYLANQGFLTAAQAGSAFGTLLVTFTNPSFTTGSEASVSVRIYNYVTAGQLPSIGFAYRGQVLRLNGSHSLSSIIRNTPSAASAPQISTNIGFEDVGINDAGALDLTPVTIQMTFYDASSGQPIGTQPTLTLHAGQVSQVTDVWATYSLPAATTDVIVIATQTGGTAQIRGYTSLKDIHTNDVAFFFMQ
jgi:hypothetical protein